MVVKKDSDLWVCLLHLTTLHYPGFGLVGMLHLLLPRASNSPSIYSLLRYQPSTASIWEAPLGFPLGRGLRDNQVDQNMHLAAQFTPSLTSCRPPVDSFASMVVLSIQ